MVNFLGVNLGGMILPRHPGRQIFPPVITNDLLLESGDHILLEDGGKILLENN